MQPLCVPEYQTEYPKCITDALGKIFQEYNNAFTPLIKKNREWETDYQYCLDRNGNPINRWVQIDMTGLPEEFLKKAYKGEFTQEALQETLRGRIFEIENSIAYYQLLQTIFEKDEEGRFRKCFRESLDVLRNKHGKNIALLTVTNSKHNDLREAEFGKTGDEILTNSEVKKISGFDAFMGPEEFKKHVEENGGNSKYLLFVRSSIPVDRLKNPKVPLEETLLSDPEMRRVIKANTITINIDDPNMPSSQKINDTKEYMQSVGMGFHIEKEEDILSETTVRYLQSGGSFQDIFFLKTVDKMGEKKFLKELFLPENEFFSEFIKYLSSQGVDPQRAIDHEDLLPSIQKIRLSILQRYAKSLGKKNAEEIYQQDTILSPEFIAYLNQQKVHPEDIISGKVRLRLKPMKESYGCYGHDSGNLANGKFRKAYRKNLEERGRYILQIEMPQAQIHNISNNTTYIFIDRNFMTIDDNGDPIFMNGYRSLIPVDHQEAKNGRIHGNGDTVWAEIFPEE